MNTDPSGFMQEAINISISNVTDGSGKRWKDNCPRR